MCLKIIHIRQDVFKNYSLSVEECADNDPCDLNTDFEPTHTSVEMDCASGVHVTRSGGYINGSDRG